MEYSISGAQGKLTYTKVKPNQKKYRTKFQVKTSTGRITVGKGVKKGSYKLTVKIRAAGNRNYSPITKKVKVTIRVK